MRILLVGDVVGRVGRRAAQALLPQLRTSLSLDLIILNAENAAGGFGLTPTAAQELFDAGANILTSGNHIWDKREVYPLLDGNLPILRPHNYPPGTPGQGVWRQDNVLVINLLGRTFIGASVDCPFQTMDRILAEPHPPVVLVDFHAEATSEKGALAWYLDGRVSAVVGTHTHVGTVDARILPHGTAFVSDLGMTGGRNSIIGDEPNAVIRRFLTGIPYRLEAAKSGPAQLNAVLVEVEENGRARSIVRVDREVDTRAW